MKNKAIYYIFTLLLFSCNVTKIKLTEYTPVTSKRDNLQCADDFYKIKEQDKTFVQSLNLDTFGVYYRSFNDFQTLYNQWKQDVIDSLAYNSELKKYKDEDSTYFAKSHKVFRYKEVSSDSTVNADVKLFVGVNKAKKEITLIVDENNSYYFRDDRIIKITPENFKQILDTLKFNVSNLRVYVDSQIINHSLPVTVNRISNSYDNFDKFIHDVVIVKPFISANCYYKGYKKVDGKNVYFIFKIFLYNIGFAEPWITVGNVPVGDKEFSKNSTLYIGNYFKVANVLYKLDSLSISGKEYTAYIKRVKKTK